MRGLTNFVVIINFHACYIKQLLNSVLIGYEELLRHRFVLSAEAEG